MRLARLQQYYPWVVVGVCFVSVAGAFGTRAAFALFFVAVIEEFQWSRGLSAGALTLGSVAWTVAAPLVGYFLDRYGPRVVFPVGALLMASGFVVTSMAQTVVQFYVGMGLLVGLGFAALPMTAQATVISNWFIRKRGVAMGIAASGIGVGILLVVPATQLLISEAGWRVAYLVLALGIVVTIVPLNAIFQRRRPQDIGLLPDFSVAGTRSGPGGRHTDPPDDCTLGQALGSLRFWLLACAVFIGALPLHMVLVHQVVAMVDLGFSKTMSASMLGLTGFFTIFSMIGMGQLSDRINRERAYTLGSLCLVGAVLVLLLLEGPSQGWLAYSFPPLFAVGFSSRQSLYPTIAADLFHGRHFGSIVGVIGLFIGAGAGVGPWLGGYLYDLSGDYDSAFVGAIILALVSIGLIWGAAPRKGPVA